MKRIGALWPEITSFTNLYQGYCNARKGKRGRPPVACGVAVVEGDGSRVSFVFDGHVASFHRPHPHKEAKPYQVLDAKRFLMQMGVKP